MSAKRGCAGAPGTCTRTGGGKNQETCLKPEAERYCWSSAQKRWVNVTEAGIKVNLQKPGFANQVYGAAARHMDTCIIGEGIFLPSQHLSWSVCVERGREILAVKQFLCIVDIFVVVLCKMFSFYSQ